MKKQPVDNTLIKRVKENGCNESYKLLSDRHEKLFYKICQNYIPIASVKGIKKGDVLENKDFVIFKAILSYKNNKNCKFSTWLGNCTKYYCLSLINSNNKLITSEEDVLKLITDTQAKEEFSEEDKYRNDKEYIFNILKGLKDQRICKVFQLRYFEDFKALDDRELQKALLAEITDEFLQKYRKRDYNDRKKAIQEGFQFEDEEKLA